MHACHSADADRPHALTVMEALKDAFHCVGLVVTRLERPTTPEQRWSWTSMQATPIDDHTLRLVMAPYQDGLDAENLAARRIVARPGGVVTLTRRELALDREWYESMVVRESLWPARMDDELISKRSFGGWVERIALVREWGDRPFSATERDLLRTFHRTCSMLHPAHPAHPAPPTPPPSMSAREHGTLQRLLAGASTKEIASQLELSYSTVAHTLTRLYRLHDVRGRAELLARYARPPEHNGMTSLAATRRGPALPKRLQQVLALLCAGATEPEISTSLGIGRATVHDHVKSLYARLGCTSRAQLLHECGLIDVKAREDGGP